MTKKCFFYTILSFTPSHSGSLNNPFAGHIQKIAQTYKNEKPVNSSGVEKIHLRCNRVKGSIVKDIREAILYTFALHKPPGMKKHKEPRIRLSKKIKESVLSHLRFF